MTTPTQSDAPADIRTHVREHYGKAAAEFKPQASRGCCSSSNTIHVDQIYEAPDAAALPEEVTGLSMGCGDPITLASLQPGQTVLDLGSGGGIDCFLAAQRVGKSGRVIGVDMTAEMIDTARRNKARLGVENVEFRLGEIEHLPAADGTVDVIISNCVINLSPDKPQVFREAYRVLKPGGRLAVSDIVTDGPLPDEIKQSLSAWAGCVAGALDAKEYIAAIEAAGFVDVELTPVYFDKATIDEAIQQLDLDEPKKGSGRGLVINDCCETQIIKLEGAAEADAERLYKAVFSAKVKARKP
jgi:ubiquinone/menaquinone biosynthesis C-methylase UbiE